MALSLIGCLDKYLENDLAEKAVIFIHLTVYADPGPGQAMSCSSKPRASYVVHRNDKYALFACLCFSQ